MAEDTFEGIIKKIEINFCDEYGTNLNFYVDTSKGKKIVPLHLRQQDTLIRSDFDLLPYRGVLILEGVNVQLGKYENSGELIYDSSRIEITSGRLGGQSFGLSLDDLKNQAQ